MRRLEPTCTRFAVEREGGVFLGATPERLAVLLGYSDDPADRGGAARRVDHGDVPGPQGRLVTGSTTARPVSGGDVGSAATAAAPRRGAAAPRAGQEGAIYAGLERLTGTLLDKEWRRDDGAVMRIDRCLIDANWGQSSDLVYQFCRQSPHASVVMPSHGRYVGASSIPFSEEYDMGPIASRVCKTIRSSVP
jgi:hypothetical protein